VSAEPARAAPIESVCPLCGTVVPARNDRCEACGMSLAGVDGRPGPFTRRALWIWAGALLAIYLVVLVVVAAVHD
jgi:hypothetical protein